MQTQTTQESTQHAEKAQVSAADLKVQKKKTPKAEENEKAVRKKAVPGPERAQSLVRKSQEKAQKAAF